jgi:hypothetical protein
MVAIRVHIAELQKVVFHGPVLREGKGIVVDYISNPK